MQVLRELNPRGTVVFPVATDVCFTLCVTYA